MKWSIRLGRLAGIPVDVHATFALLLAWVGLVHWRQSGELGAVFEGVAFVLALFGCVLLHEFGHALAARRFGIRTRDITLLPIGGVARLERMPDRPVQEFWVALAGPAVNVAIAVALFVWLWLTHSLVPVESVGVARGSFLERLMVVNLLLVGFNLIPAFPMDGGRVLRALLAMRLDYARATRIAAGLGQGMALLFGFIGLFWNPFLVFIALFVWIGAASESAMVRARSAFENVPVSAAMLTDYRTLAVTDRLDQAVELVLAGSQRDFPVLDQGRFVGLLTQAGLLRALASGGLQGSVRGAVEATPITVDAREMLDIALSRMQAAGIPASPVIESGRLVGILTLDNVGEFLSIRRAVGKTGTVPGLTPRWSP